MPSKLLLSGCLFLTFLAALTSSSPVENGGNVTCIFKNTAPILDPSEMTQLISLDGTALAHISSYVRDVGPLSAEVFLPLKFESVRVRGGKHRSELIFVADCGQIAIKTGLTEYQEKVIDGIELNFKSQDGTVKTCSTRNLQMIFGEDKHYSCRKHSVYPCYANSSDNTYMEVAEINLNLEFETGRDPSKTENGYYSTSAEVCKS